MTPKGKKVRTSTFGDANLLHDLTTGRSVTGLIHMLNQTPIDWFSKRQGQVETATYGSEFVAARTAVEQIIDLRYTLRMFGVPLDGPAWLFGDNQSVITSSTIPHSTLTKRWNALSYHRVREAVAAGYIRFHFIASAENPSDIMTKALEHAAAWPHVDTLMFRKGETTSSSSHSVLHAQRGVTPMPTASQLPTDPAQVLEETRDQSASAIPRKGVLDRFLARMAESVEQPLADDDPHQRRLLRPYPAPMKKRLLRPPL